MQNLDLRAPFPQQMIFCPSKGLVDLVHWLRYICYIVKPFTLLSFSDLLCLPVSLPRFVILAIFAVIFIFGIFVPSVKSLSLLSFKDLLYLPELYTWFVIISLLSFNDYLYLSVSLPWFIIFVIFAVINCCFRYIFFGMVVTFVIFAIAALDIIASTSLTYERCILKPSS